MTTDREMVGAAAGETTATPVDSENVNCATSQLSDHTVEDQVPTSPKRKGRPRGSRKSKSEQPSDVSLSPVTHTEPPYHPLPGQTSFLEGGDGQVSSLEPAPDSTLVSGRFENLNAIRLGQDFESEIDVETLIVSIPVKKPGKEYFVRCRPEPEFRILTKVLELKEVEQEIYYVDRSLWLPLAAEPRLSPRLLITAITNLGNIFLWPLRYAEKGETLDTWSKSLLACANLAQTKWVRVLSNRSAGCYQPQIAKSLDEPVWPDMSLSKILDIAFEDKFIDSLDHPVIRKLSGIGPDKQE